MININLAAQTIACCFAKKNKTQKTLSAQYEQHYGVFNILEKYPLHSCYFSRIFISLFLLSWFYLVYKNNFEAFSLPILVAINEYLHLIFYQL